MDSKKNDAIDALTNLAGGMDGKSETAKIREVIDYVELALSSGVNREKILDTLRESLGLKMNFRTFETTLHRLRKKRKSENKIRTNTHRNVLCSDNDINSNLIKSDKVLTVYKETLPEKKDNKLIASNKQFTPKEIRLIRENALKELDKDSAINYD